MTYRGDRPRVTKIPYYLEGGGVGKGMGVMETRTVFGSIFCCMIVFWLTIHCFASQCRIAKLYIAIIMHL